uniref:Uncharacterized protein n=1 Tax=Siphoviridae sp. ctCNm48 TaxID=2825377 RepID=A0A8S5TW90_9CAUD|nr:MAG TPA: hypothetical protein [Siphoviridae sp. ctCNm48]
MPPRCKSLESCAALLLLDPLRRMRYNRDVRRCWIAICRAADHLVSVGRPGRRGPQI